MDQSILGALLAAACGAIATIVVAWRKLSGRITTTTADRLWSEATALREEYAQTARELRAEINDCRERIKVLENDNAHLHDENLRLIEKVESLSRDNERLRHRNGQLEARIDELEAALDA